MSKLNKKIRISDVMLAALAALIFILVLKKSNVAIEYMKSGLNLCAQTVIPSLFPFMVISDILISTGVGEALGHAMSYPMRKIFGISGYGSCAFIMGSLCGFPIGAKTAVSLYSKGQISNDELTFLLTFSNNPGSAFVISAIGVALFSNKALGIMMYFCVILSSITVGLIGSIYYRKKIKLFELSNHYTPQKPSVSLFTSAVVSSANSMLYVCAYVVFFSAVVGCLQSIMSGLYIPQIINALIFGFFEISSGVCKAAEIENPLIAQTVCAFIAAWSGLSVHFQIMSVCSNCNVSFKPFIIAKFFQGILCALYTYLCSGFLFPAFSKCQIDTSAFLNIKPSPTISFISLILFSSAIIISFLGLIFSSIYMKGESK